MYPPRDVGRMQLNIRCTKEFLRRVDEYLGGPGKHFGSRADFIRYVVLAYLDGNIVHPHASPRVVAPAPPASVVAAAEEVAHAAPEQETPTPHIDTSRIDDGFLEEFS